MDFQVKFDINEKIYLKNPESSDLGKQIVKHAIDLIYLLGIEQFTFRKLAIELNSTEATIYRYFENKHKLLLYILNWYWNLMEFMVNFKIENVKDNKQKLKIIIELLTQELNIGFGQFEYNMHYLYSIVMLESSKVYLIKEVAEINRDEVFKPYKDLCAKIAEIISSYNPMYKYPHSLSTTLIEASHHQQFFSQNLPRLTDVQSIKKLNYTQHFLEDFLFRILG